MNKRASTTHSETPIQQEEMPSADVSKPRGGLNVGQRAINNARLRASSFVKAPSQPG